MKIICYHHSKDPDGWVSGAVIKRKYPDVELRGWDYKDQIPAISEVKDSDKLILIDITFPLPILQEMGKITNLTVIDHHVSFKKEVEKYAEPINFDYIYDCNKAACEIGWEYCFPETPTPYGIILNGRYDTFRKNEGDWENETLPFKYFLTSICNSVESVPQDIFFASKEFINDKWCVIGKGIMSYVDTMNETHTRFNHFIVEKAFGKYKALCLNYWPFNSEVMKSIWDPKKYDIMIGFCFDGRKYSVSLRSVDENPDVSVIAKERGGGGHRNAAGFEVSDLLSIFK